MCGNRSKKLKFEAKFDSFPREISEDIFLRLPIKSLIRCTAVRKSWRSVIKNPSFIRTHLSRRFNSNDQYDTQLLLLHGVSGGETYGLGHSIRFSKDEIQEFHSLHYDNPAFDEYCKIKVPIVDKKKMWNPCFRVVGTCNGLVCLADDLGPYGYNFIVFNPSIRKSVTLPKPSVRFKTHGGYDASIGFGFDAMTNDYKVVRLVTLLDEHSRLAKCRTVVEVYSLATGSWSMLPDVARRFQMDAHTPQAFVNGALHWQAFRWKKDGFYYFILLFDVGRNLFREIKMPDSIKPDVSSGPTLQLSVSGDGMSIALFRRGYSDAGFVLDVWVMKEYCVHESWTLMRLCPLGPQGSLLPRVLCFRKSSEVVVYKQIDKASYSGYSSCPGYELFSIDLVSQQLKSLGICGYSYYSVNSYEESLVLLDMDNAVSY